jgi:phage protein D
MLKVTPTITIGGAALPAELANLVTEITYKEGLKFTSDTVNLHVADPGGVFRRTFRIKATIPVTLSITVTGGLGSLTKNCGTFYIHTLNFKGNKSGGCDIDIECTSTPVKSDNSIRTERKSRGTEKTTLKDLAAKIAKENGLGFSWQVKANPKIGRTDSHDESDLVHLNKHCSDNDLIMKVKDQTLYILDHDALEKQPPVGIIIAPSPLDPGGINGVGGLLSFHMTESTEDVYKACEVAYYDPRTGKMIKRTVNDPDNADLGITHRYKHFPDDDESTNLNDPDTSKDVADNPPNPTQYLLNSMPFPLPPIPGVKT